MFMNVRFIKLYYYNIGLYIHTIEKNTLNYVDKRLFERNVLGLPDNHKTKKSTSPLVYMLNIRSSTKACNKCTECGPSQLG